MAGILAARRSHDDVAAMTGQRFNYRRSAAVGGRLVSRANADGPRIVATRTAFHIAAWRAEICKPGQRDAIFNKFSVIGPECFFYLYGCHRLGA